MWRNLWPGRGQTFFDPGVVKLSRPALVVKHYSDWAPLCLRLPGRDQIVYHRLLVNPPSAISSRGEPPSIKERRSALPRPEEVNPFSTSKKRSIPHRLANRGQSSLDQQTSSLPRPGNGGQPFIDPQTGQPYLDQRIEVSPLSISEQRSAIPRSANRGLPSLSQRTWVWLPLPSRNSETALDQRGWVKPRATNAEVKSPAIRASIKFFLAVIVWPEMTLWPEVISPHGLRIKSYCTLTLNGRRSCVCHGD